MNRREITKRIVLLNQSLAERKTKKEMLEDLLSGDKELSGLIMKLELAKEAVKQCKEILMNEPDARKISFDIKDISLEIRETKSLLSDELLSFFVEEQSFDLEDGEGETYRLKFSGQAKRKGDK